MVYLDNEVAYHETMSGALDKILMHGLAHWTG